MSTNTHSTKFLVREYLERRAHDPAPPPTPEEIRRQLGWGSVLPDFKPAPPATAVATSNKRAMVDLVAETKTDTIMSRLPTRRAS